MPPRLRIRRRQRDGQHFVRFEGEVDGSTACHALDVLAQAAQCLLAAKIDQRLQHLAF